MSFEERDRARPRVGDGPYRPRLHRASSKWNSARSLGEEVLRVVRNTDRTEATVAIYGSQTTIPRPGRERTNDGRAGFVGTTNATLTNGMARSGYIPDDASFGKDTLQRSISSRASS